MYKKNQFAVLILIIFFLVGFFIVNHPSKNLTSKNIQYVKIAGQSIKVELALTPLTQTQGLSGRSGLKEDEGMLFIFPESGNHPFWMKDMNFPIDMIWITEDMRVVYIKKDARPESYPETYSPGSNSKYVLEVISGFSDKYNLKEGDGIEFEY